MAKAESAYRNGSAGKCFAQYGHAHTQPRIGYRFRLYESARPRSFCYTIFVNFAAAGHHVIDATSAALCCGAQ